MTTADLSSSVARIRKITRKVDMSKGVASYKGGRVTSLSSSMLAKFKIFRVVTKNTK
jgi:hypothetical protein